MLRSEAARVDLHDEQHDDHSSLAWWRARTGTVGDYLCSSASTKLAVMFTRDTMSFFGHFSRGWLGEICIMTYNALGYYLRCSVEEPAKRRQSDLKEAPQDCSIGGIDSP